MTIKYANYDGPHRAHAVIDGKTVPFDARVGRRLAENAILLSLGAPEIARTIDTPQRARDRQAATQLRFSI